MMNEESVIIWTVKWNERRKVHCATCCTDEHHPWTPKIKTFNTARDAYDQESYLHEHSNEQYGYEVEDIRTLTGIAYLTETYLTEISEK